jgi:SAM-dependent methyltransferase
MTVQSGLKDQYRDASGLHARVNLHDRFSTNPLGWHRWVFDHLDLPGGSRILEVGCGDGALWSKNADRIPDRWTVTLGDFSPGMVLDVRRTLRAVGPWFAYAAFDAQAIPFADGHFDAVIANHMLYHVPDRPRALAEIGRVLRPGGRLFASTAGTGHLRELHELTERFAPDRDRWAWTGDFAETFTLENGAEQLRPWFANVVLSRYEDALRVTEAEPLVAYILSSRAGGALTDENRRRLRAFIGEEIGARGAFHIAKDPGLFEAW